jgi:hypothetical protein
LAKLRDGPITAKDLAEYLETQDDFALELHIYSQAKALGYNVAHGGTYIDPVTKKARQFDVRASFSSIEGKPQRIDLAIECKCLKPSFPLLLTRIPRSETESFHQVIWSHKRNTSLPVYSSKDYTTPAFLKGTRSFYKPGQYVGKSTSQVGRTEKGDVTSGDAEVFEKWSQALASAHGLVAAAGRANELKKQDNYFCCVLPILVVSDNTLWAADYSEDGVLQAGPVSVDEATIFVGHEYDIGIKCMLSHLHVYTKRGIDSFLANLAQETNLWSEFLGSDNGRT